MTLVGLDKAREEVARLSKEAIDFLDELSAENDFLKEVILYLIHREK